MADSKEFKVVLTDEQVKSMKGLGINPKITEAKLVMQFEGHESPVAVKLIVSTADKAGKDGQARQMLSVAEGNPIIREYSKFYTVKSSELADSKGNSPFVTEKAKALEARAEKLSKKVVSDTGNLFHKTLVADETETRIAGIETKLDALIAALSKGTKAKK